MSSLLHLSITEKFADLRGWSLLEQCDGIAESSGFTRCLLVRKDVPLCLWTRMNICSMVLPMYVRWQQSQLYSYITQDHMNASV